MIRIRFDISILIRIRIRIINNRRDKIRYHTSCKEIKNS